MGKGIDAARQVSPLHAAVLDDLKDQLLIVFLNRMGGDVSIPIDEIDATGKYTMSFSIIDRVFNFKVGHKQ